MSLIKQISGGLIAGVLGALVWGMIAYFTHYEIGWLAIGVGAAVGFGIRTTWNAQPDMTSGMTAGAIAMGSVALGKVLAVTLMAQDITSQLKLPKADASRIILSYASEIVEDRRAQKKRIAWANGKDHDNAMVLSDYPKDIVKEANTKWEKLGADGQKKALADSDADMGKMAAMLVGDVRAEGFRQMFKPIDLLFFGLATFAAFRLASGMSDD